MTGEERAPRRTKLIVISLVISLIASSCLLGGAIYIKARQENELQQSLIENCENSPVRKVLTEILKQEVSESESPLVYKLFPQLSHEELEHLIRKSDVRKRKRMGEIEPADCEAQYSK